VKKNDMTVPRYSKARMQAGSTLIWEEGKNNGGRGEKRRGGKGRETREASQRRFEERGHTLYHYALAKRSHMPSGKGIVSEKGDGIYLRGVIIELELN